MRLHLREELILSRILPILVLLPFFGFYLLSTLREYYIDRIREDMRRTAAVLTDVLQMDPALADDTGRLQELLHRADTQTPTRIQIIDQNGIILASTESTDAPLIGTISQESAVKSALAGKASNEASLKDLVTIAIPVTSAGHIGALRLSLQMSDVAPVFNRLTLLVITGIFVLLLLSLVIAYMLGTTLSKSLNQLAYEAKTVAEGDYSHHVQPKGEIEIADIARHFNEMVDQLLEQRTTRQRLLNDIAHELRQPISAIRTAIEVIQGALDDIPEPIRHLLDGLLCEIDRLSRITNRLDFAARDGQMPVLSNRIPVDISSIIKQNVQFFEPEAQRLGIKLNFKLPDALPLVGLFQGGLLTRDLLSRRQFHSRLARGPLRGGPDFLDAQRGHLCLAGLGVNCVAEFFGAIAVRHHVKTRRLGSDFCGMGVGPMVFVTRGGLVKNLPRGILDLASVIHRQHLANLVRALLF